MQGAPALFALIGGRPMPILQGLPADDELQQIVRSWSSPKLNLAGRTAGRRDRHRAVFRRPGLGRRVPVPASGDGAGAAAGADVVPPRASGSAPCWRQQGDYAGAAAAYEQVLQAEPQRHAAPPASARRRCCWPVPPTADVREVRAAAADQVPTTSDAQLAVADVDMIGGQIQDAFARLLDYRGGRATRPIRSSRCASVCSNTSTIPEPTDERLKRARRRLATLMY